MTFSDAASTAWRWVAGWPWKELLSGIFGALVVILYQRRVDAAKREPGLAVRLVSKDTFINLSEAIAVSEAVALGISVDGKVISSPAPTPPSPPPPPAPSPPADTNYDLLHLLVRNLSERPAGIVDLKLLDESGKELPINIREYRKRLAVPVVLKAWGVQALQLRVDDVDRRLARTLALVDMDDRELRLPITDNSSRWFSYR